MKVAFLRGINVSGKNKIEMTSLKEMFKSLGATHITTYLNTGNVIFDSDSMIEESLIEEKIKMTFDLEISVLIRTRDEVKELIKSYNLDEGPKNCYMTLFKTPIDTSIEPFVLKVKLETDMYAILDKSIFLFVPNGYGKTKLTNNYFEKKTGLVATTRNLRTMTKVSDLLG